MLLNKSPLENLCSYYILWMSMNLYYGWRWKFKFQLHKYFNNYLYHSKEFKDSGKVYFRPQSVGPLVASGIRLQG